MADTRVERRLAAILAADVAGYSRLMGIDEEGTLAALKRCRRELIDPKIAEHRGRIVKISGDGALVEFASAVDAVRCAIEIQRIMAGRNTAVPEARRIEFRIGINVGDIIIDEGDIYGDGVNIAARVEALAIPGCICLSDNAYQQIKGKLALEADDMGEQRLKNIVQPVHVYSVRPDAAPGRAALVLPDKPSIAVLPFQNMSGDPEQQYFADGMVEDIITGLSHFKSLFVIARNSSFIYRGQSVDVKRVGRELGVRYILEGSVRKVSNRIRVTGQLVEAETGNHLWAQRYDRPFDDVFALQDELTLNVTGAIEPSLREAEIERVRRKRPESLDAYDLVLRALPHATVPMPGEATKAISLLARALELEPEYARAHAYVSWCHEILFTRAGFREENRVAAIRHADAAIAHGRDDATALALGAFVTAMLMHDRPTALGIFERALALSPSSALTLFYGSVAAAWAGDVARAIDWGERALRLSPFDRMAYCACNAIALAHFHNERFEEAAVSARKAVQSNPAFSICHLILAASLAKLGRIAEAKLAAERVLALQPAFTIGGICGALAVPSLLAAPLTEAWQMADLPA